MIGIMALGSVHSGFLPRVADVAMLTSGTGSPYNVAKPTDVVQGDLLLAPMVADGSTAGWASTGWTTQGINGSGTLGPYSIASCLLGKTAGSSETGPYSFTATNTNAKAGGILACRSAAIDTVSSISRNGGTNAVTISSFTAVRGKLLFVHQYYNSGGALTVTPPSGFTLVSGASSANSNTFLAVYEKDVAAGATGSISATINGTSSMLHAGYVVNLKGIDAP